MGQASQPIPPPSAIHFPHASGPALSLPFGHAAADGTSPILLKIWSGQDALIENTFRLQRIDAMKTLDPDFSPTGITVTYRASAHKPDAHPKEAAPR